MRLIQLEGAFGFDQLREREVPAPEPAEGEVLLRMLAAALNYRDLLMIRGRYDPRQPLPLIPVSDGVGVVERVGAGVDGLVPGDRVCPVLLPDWQAGEPDRLALRRGLGGRLSGVLRELMLVRPEHVVKVPEHLTDVEAATLPCAGVTAWNALVTLGHLRAGQIVLVQGTGGVAMAALQIARTFGARVVVTSRSDEKLKRAMELGAEHGINYAETPAWGDAVRERYRPWGVDHVVEVGGAGTLAQSLRAVRTGGTISVIGVLAGGRAPVDVLPILMNQVRLQGVFCGSRASFEGMNRALAANRVHPVVDTVFPFSLAGLRAALDHLAAGRHVGKVALRF